MESLKEMHQGDFEVMSISEHPELLGTYVQFQLFSRMEDHPRGFFDLLCLTTPGLGPSQIMGKRWLMIHRTE